MQVIDYFSRKTRTNIITTAIMMVIMLGVLDYLTGYEFSFSIFYLLPVLFAGWFAGKLPAAVVSFLSSTSWLCAELLAGKTYSHFAILAWNSIMLLLFFLLFAYLLDAIHTLLEKEKGLARIDPLTGAANLRHFTELTNRELKRSVRFKRPITLTYMDIDNFKQINDAHGHSTGDRLLSVMASTIRKNVRATDIIARLGGDEFAILMPETRSEQARSAIEKLQKSIHDALAEHGWPVTMSIGVATCNNPPCTVDEFIKMADNLMYAAKNSGKNMIKYVVI